MCVVQFSQGIEAQVVDLTLDVDKSSGKPHRIRLSLILPYTAFRVVERAEHFNNFEEIRESTCIDFSPELETVEIELALETRLNTRFNETRSDSEARSMLEAASPNDALLESEHWYLLNAKQAVCPGLKVGYATAWSRARSYR